MDVTPSEEGRSDKPELQEEEEGRTDCERGLYVCPIVVDADVPDCVPGPVLACHGVWYRGWLAGLFWLACQDSARPAGRGKGKKAIERPQACTPGCAPFRGCLQPNQAFT